MKGFLFTDLNPRQQEAVRATEGPVLVLAGAGSGKTRVLTYRIAYLLQEQKAKPWEILAMTFTNKAAGEMKERVKQFIGKEDGLWIGTFHSIFARILRWEAGALGYPGDYVIYDTDDQKRLLKSIIDDMNLSASQFNTNAIQSVISRAKNSLIEPSEYANLARTRMEEVAAQIYPVYQERLRRNYAFDFDDLITMPIRLFDQHSDILEKYQTRFRYILVDEYQDTNRAQYYLVHALAKNHRNLCVVGDDDQSIYRWRGADLRNILDFEKDFPGTRIFRLEQNYRSTQNILVAANSVVRKNRGRKEKTLWSDREPGEKVELIEVDDERVEAEKIVAKIQIEAFRGKRGFKDFVLLYRTNAQSRALEEGLRRNGIRYIIVGGVRFYERKEIKDILSYLKIIVNPNDSVSINRVINFPPRGIGDVSIQRVHQFAAGQGITLFQALERIEDVPAITARVRKSAAAFVGLIRKYGDLKDKFSLPELVHALVDEVGLIAMYKEDSTPEGQGRVENIKEFLAAVSDYAESTEASSLSGFLTGVSLMTDVDAWDDQSNAVTLMTLHCAKGLEFPVVFIAGMEEGLFPLSRSAEDADALEEERRLFYVGITRARDKVYLSCARTRHLFGEGGYRLPSRFLDELDASVIHRESDFSQHGYRFRQTSVHRSSGMTGDSRSHPDYESFSQEIPLLRTGVHVDHASFGRGKVVGVEGAGDKQKAVIHFESGMQKKLLVRYAQLTILE